jgi:hypothetical protein
MRPIFAVLFFVVALGFLPAAARVGETLDQCKKRYGKATPIPQVYDFGEQAKDLAYYNFEKNGIEIQIGFLNGIASDLSFHHHADAASDASVPNLTTPNAFTPFEIETLLADNASGMAWKTVQDGKLIFFPDTPSLYTRYGNYQRRDDGVMATVDGTTLHIFTADWMAYVNAKMKAHTDEEMVKQKKNLEGF